MTCAEILSSRSVPAVWTGIHETTRPMTSPGPTRRADGVFGLDPEVRNGPAAGSRGG